MFKESVSTIEETYMKTNLNLDGDGNVNSALYNERTGFVFDYPMRWLNDTSVIKGIGIRRLQVIPTTHMLQLYFVIGFDLTSSGSFTQKAYNYIITVDQTDSVDSILTTMISELNNNWLSKTEYGTDDITTRFFYDFDPSTGALNLRIKMLDKTNSTILPEDENRLVFVIGGYGYDPAQEVNNINMFLKFLNQPLTDANRAVFANPSFEKSFSGVWNRTKLIFHSSFSESIRNVIGVNNDFYQYPTVIYKPPTNSSNFWIKFSTDGVHFVLPLYCDFYISFCYMMKHNTNKQSRVLSTG